MLAAAASISGTVQIIVSCRCSWLSELLTCDAESACVVAISCRRGGGGGDVPRAFPQATEVAVPHLGLPLWRLCPSMVDVPLGIRMVWVPIFFPLYGFYHRPGKENFKQILLFRRILFWNTAYGVIYRVVFPLAEITLSSGKYCILNCLARQNWTIYMLFSFMNFFKDIF